MRIAVLSGPPCAGKTTLARQVARPGDAVLDYDVIARSLGSPAWWLHPEPYRTAAEQELQARLAMAHARIGPGTAWLLRTAPRPVHRMALAQRWQAGVYVLDPGEWECRRRAARRPAGTGTHVAQWYHRYRPWSGDRDAIELMPSTRGGGQGSGRDQEPT